MSIQILILETGESVIADVREALDPEANKSLGYLVDQPYEVRVAMHRRIDTAELADADINDASSVEFRAWAPLSAERTYRFTEDFVRCIYTPHQEVVGQYFEILQKWQKENTKVVEIDKSATNTSPFLAASQEETIQALEGQGNPGGTN